MELYPTVSPALEAEMERKAWNARSAELKALDRPAPRQAGDMV